jgi:hypothetical protein
MTVTGTLAVLGLWVLLSIVFGVVVGKCIALGDRPYPGSKEAEHEDARR